MKNKKIINSLNKILPNDKKKKIILNNIINEKKNQRIFSIPAIAFCLVLAVSLFIINNKQTNTLPLVRTTDNQIIYNSKCYEEKGIYNGEYRDLEFVEETSEYIMGNKIYKRGNSIYFKNNENYIEYELCKEK